MTDEIDRWAAYQGMNVPIEVVRRWTPEQRAVWERAWPMGGIVISDIPGRKGSQGPFPARYGDLHVYARDVYSGAGNCVCGRSLGDRVHTEAAPGIPIPERMRP